MDLNLQSAMSVLMTTISEVGTNADLQCPDLYYPIHSRRLSVDLSLQSAMSILMTTISYQVGTNPDL